MNEERMRPGSWLGPVLRVLFSALTVLVDGKKGIKSVKNLCHLSPKVLSWNR